MGFMNSKSNRRVAPSDINDNETMISTSTTTRTTESSDRSLVTKFVVVWLDANVNDADQLYQSSMVRLQRIATTIHTFTNLDACTQFLHTIPNESVLMVVSNEFVSQICPSFLSAMPHIHSVYVLCSDKEDREVLSPLVPNAVQEVVTDVCDPVQRHQDSLMISIIPSKKLTKQDLQHINRSFTYWMMIKSIILNSKYQREVHKQALTNLTEFARQRYSTDPIELAIIDEFEHHYHQHSPIWWYTRNCFLRSILDQVFQSEDIELVLRTEFFIRDLNQQLETTKKCKLPTTVYRSHAISNEDLERIRDSKGSLLAFNGFFTAQSDYEASLNSVRNKNTEVGIVFCLKIESKHPASAFASLQNLSYSFDQSKSILFSMHSLFRIGDIKQTAEQIWQIDLTLITHKDEQVKCLHDLLREETRGIAGWLKLPYLMSASRHFDFAKELYQTILRLTPTSDPLKMACIYNELGNIEEDLGEYTSALSFYQKAIDLRRDDLPGNARSLSVSYNNLGEMQRQLGNYADALFTHQRTLAMKKRILPADDLSIATSYNNIALVNESLGQFLVALDFHRKALAIKLKSLPADHQDLGTTYNNIGELERSMGNYQSALENLERALQIRLQKYSPTHPSLASVYNNIGLIYRELGDYTTALSYSQKSLDVKLSTFPSDHPSLTFTYNNIGDINHQLGEFSNALTSYQKALEIQQKIFSETHPEIATTYTNIGSVHQALDQYVTALSFYRKAVDIREKTLPAHHPALGTCYNNIGHVHELMGEYTAALEYYQKTLKLQEKSLRQNHPSFAATYNNLAGIHINLGKPDKALTLYKKCLEIKKKSLSPSHPTLVTTYNNIGVLYQSMGNYSAALEYYKQTLELQQKTLPPNHPELAIVCNNIGASYHLMKDYSRALTYYKRALDILGKSLPTNHPNLALIHSSMATIFVDLGDIQLAYEHQQQAVDIACEALPSDHPHLKLFQDYLQRIQAKLVSDE